MAPEIAEKDRLTKAIRWAARLWSIVTIALVALLSVGEGIHPVGPAETLGVLLFPGGICLGLIVAWWAEGVGGAITVASLLSFYVLHTVTAGRLPQGWAWVVLAFPGVLFLWCSKRTHQVRTTHSTPSPSQASGRS